MKKHPLIFAHRGVRGTHPENTMIAFKEAARIGADGIELDVQLSKDGEVIIIHDETLDRTTTGSGFAKDYTLEELKTLDAGVKFKEQFAGEQIPSLREFFPWVSPTSLLVNVELKNDEIEYEQLEEKVVALIEEFKLEKRIILSSFNHESIQKLATLSPHIERALLYDRPGIRMMRNIHKREANGFHPNFLWLTKRLVRKMQEQNLPVRPYTVNKPKDMRRMISYGVDVIMTDYPELAFELLRTRKKV